MRLRSMLPELRPNLSLSHPDLTRGLRPPYSLIIVNGPTAPNLKRILKCRSLSILPLLKRLDTSC